VRTRWISSWPEVEATISSKQEPQFLDFVEYNIFAATCANSSSTPLVNREANILLKLNKEIELSCNSLGREFHAAGPESLSLLFLKLQIVIF